VISCIADRQCDLQSGNACYVLLLHYLIIYSFPILENLKKLVNQFCTLFCYMKRLFCLQDMGSGSDVTDNSSNEASHIKATTIRGHIGLPKQVRLILQFLVYMVSGIEKIPANNKLFCITVGHIHC
jgi:hypothetical protein